ncbi:ATPase Sec18, required for ER to Golgi transport etc [Trichoderma guizhouense]|uniref:Vesicular-fusion protein SEC18 n=1 Tax=Trichoderma guizhouense TaxID=1491466 RepID=A0A1T3CPV5_9HYPO|nr:ATPase Sec18, required for ER to Golgi transport etc [Trichoderma guizhouense]
MSRAPPGGASYRPYGGGPQAPYGGGGGSQGYPQGGYSQGSYQGSYQPPAQPSRHTEKGPSGGGRVVSLQVEKVTDKSQQARLIYGNVCAVSPEDFPPKLDKTDYYILLRAGQPPGEFVVTARPIQGYPRGCISLSDPQRTWCRVALRDTFTGEVFDPFASGSKAYLGSLDVEVGFASPTKRIDGPYDEDHLSKLFIDTFQNQVLAPGQRILMDVQNIPLMIVVKTVGLVDLSMADEGDRQQMQREAHARGILTNQTRVIFHRDAKGGFNLKPSASKPNPNSILAPNFKFEDMGIGGLGGEISTIFRRAFASRVFPPQMVANMGIEHVRGMLLFGPPGTGKTLIARKIGQTLNARPPKVINGPEVLNKYVGQSEENIRKLFADAEKEYKEKGDESGLHIIIFDELDAVCKQRGSGTGGGTGVGDSIVNQLLSKLDGVDQLNNILLIGMTNRKDLIDEALLRPGRLEVHVEIPLPNEPGRLEILKIHTAKARENNRVDPDVDLEELAGLTKNFSGAEINGLVKSAASCALSRHTELGTMAVIRADSPPPMITRADFMNALNEVQPAFGVSESKLIEATDLGIIRYADRVDTSIRKVMGIANMVKSDPQVFLSSVLFHGSKGSGKTALAAHIAMESGFPFIKLVTPSDLAGYRDEFGKRDYIHKAFTDAYKSTASIIILDDIERLIGWNPIGPRFSNAILDLLTVLIAARPPKGHRLLVFVTTSQYWTLKDLDALRDFGTMIEVPPVSDLYELQGVLRESPALDDTSAEQTIQMLKNRTGLESIAVGVGIKSILNRTFEARNQGSGNLVETLVELLAAEIERK